MFLTNKRHRSLSFSALHMERVTRHWAVFRIGSNLESGWGPAPCGGPQPTPNHGAWPAPGLLTCSSSRAIRASWDWAFCREVENVHFPPSPFYGPGCSGGHRLIWGVAPSQSNGGSRPRVDARSAGQRAALFLAADEWRVHRLDCPVCSGCATAFGSCLPLFIFRRNSGARRG